MTTTSKCTICPIGHGAITPCTNTTDSSCEPCTIGYYSPIADHQSSCERCAQCPLFAIELLGCNSTHNTRCQCLNNYHGVWHSHDGSFICRPCTICAPGTRVQLACTTSDNAQCAPCPVNTYSSTFNAENCRKCSNCTHDQMVMQSCTRYTDTVCIDAHHNDQLISIYCAMLASIILGLVVYVIVKQRYANGARNKKKPASSLPLLASNGHHPKLSDQCIALLSIELNVGDGWITVANELGYGNHVSIFEAHATSNNAARVMLDRWNIDDRTELIDLVRALNRHRPSLAQLVCRDGAQSGVAFIL